MSKQWHVDVVVVHFFQNKPGDTEVVGLLQAPEGGDASLDKVVLGKV